MNRRSFFKRITGAIAGIVGLSAKSPQKVKVLRKNEDVPNRTGRRRGGCFHIDTGKMSHIQEYELGSRYIDENGRPWRYIKKV